MTVEFGLLMLAVAGLAGCGSWLASARSPHSGWARRDVRAIALAIGLEGLAGVVGLIVGGLMHPAALAVLVAATCVAAVAVADACRSGAIGPVAAQTSAEAVLIGGSLASVFWAAVGAPSQPDLPAATAITLLTSHLTVAVLIARMPSVPGPPSPAVRPVPYGVLVALVAMVLISISDAMLVVTQLGFGPPPAVAPELRTLAMAAVAVAPWVLADRWATAKVPVQLTRALPYALVAAAVAAHLIAAFRRPIGPVSLLLVALVVGALAVVQGLGRRENARLLHDLEASRTRLSALVENAGDVILAIDTTGRVISANGAAARLLHRTPGTLAGLDVAELAVVADRARLRATVDPVVRGRRTSGRVELRLAAPATGTAELRLQAVVGGAVANLSDVTDAVQLRDRLERLARFDDMTGLPNRTHLLDEIDTWLRGGRPVAVLYTDLDDFKAVNDRFGHGCGDDVLVEAARRLQLAVRGLPVERAVVARMGGDEFVVALLGARSPEVRLAADRLLDAMRPTFGVADRAVRVGLSVGVTTTDDPADLQHADPQHADLQHADLQHADLQHADHAGAARLLHRADVAMYAAKQAGRFRVVHWDAALEARSLRRVDIAIGLRRALEGRRLALAYQPLVRLADGVVIGAEALVRVSPSDRGPGGLAGLAGLVTPAELVAVAEATGEIGELGRWVLTEATAQAARWQAAGHDVFVTVNVSVRQMADQGLVEDVARALAAVQLPSEKLVIEITEGQLLCETDPAWQALEQLRALGVDLVIDDFGSGYSSLAYLRRMPVRGVKLDRALVDDLSTDPRARTLVRAVTSAARALGLLVVAEGLESLEAARAVRDLGAWAGQGFALFQALSADEVLQVFAEPPVSLGGSDVVRLVRTPVPPQLAARAPISHDETARGAG